MPDALPVQEHTYFGNSTLRITADAMEVTFRNQYGTIRSPRTVEVIECERCAALIINDDYRKGQHIDDHERRTEWDRQQMLKDYSTVFPDLRGIVQ